MLTGILVPNGGETSVAGLNPLHQRRELAKHIGVVFGKRSQLWWDLPLIDSLRLRRHLYRVPEARFNANLAQLRSMLALDEFIDTPVRQLSLGQRMRGDLAAALLHDPELLYRIANHWPGCGSQSSYSRVSPEDQCRARSNGSADHT